MNVNMPECEELKKKYDDCYKKWIENKPNNKIASLHDCNDVFEVCYKKICYKLLLTYTLNYHMDRIIRVAI